MYRQYSFSISEDGSYKFTTDLGLNYLVYFSETPIVDLENNTHILLNLGFSRNGEHSCKPFTDKHDEKIRNTIMFIVNDVFAKNDHQVLIYCCFGDDGYSRHRKIVFNSWGKYLDSSVEKYQSEINYEENKIYGSLMVVKDNPLKKLIVDAFRNFISDLEEVKPTS